MTDLSNLIQYENENTALDFKAIQYKKDNNENFLKDIISLANAITKNQKFIIIGVKHYSNGERDLLGIDENFIDDASYQQIVDSNIEPHLSFKYFPYKYENKIFGIFQILECSNPPYMMKKALGKLNLGDSFIRRGSHQTRLTRKDIDYYESTRNKSDISDNIVISFSEKESIANLVTQRNEFELPSTLKKREIESVIRKKEESNSPLKNFTISSYNPFSFVPYENRSLDDLRLNLNNVMKDYEEEDTYCLFEQNAYKINFYIHNKSTEFLEDVSIEITVKKTDQFLIRDDIYVKSKKYHPLIKDMPRVATWEEINYPSVKSKDEEYIINNELKHVKHHLPTEILSVPIRVVLFSRTEILIKFQIKVFAKNLDKPIINILQLTFPEQVNLI